jgi:hypothetical protein
MRASYARSSPVSWTASITTASSRFNSKARRLHGCSVTSRTTWPTSMPDVCGSSIRESRTPPAMRKRSTLRKPCSGAGTCWKPSLPGSDRSRFLGQGAGLPRSLIRFGGQVTTLFESLFFLLFERTPTAGVPRNSVIILHSCHHEHHVRHLCRPSDPVNACGAWLKSTFLSDHHPSPTSMSDSLEALRANR